MTHLLVVFAQVHAARIGLAIRIPVRAAKAVRHSGLPRLFPIGITILCLLLPPLGIVSAAGQSPAAQKQNPSSGYSFDLTRGAGDPVCAAYLERLQQTHFSRPPYCDRPESSNIEGFNKLSRVPLEIDEILNLEREAIGFLSRRDPLFLDKYRSERSRLGLAYTTDAELREAIVLNLKSNDPLRVPVRLSPFVDVDNDGIPDRVVLWRDRSNQCGAQLPDGRPHRTATYALVLNSKGALDAAKTQRVFGHPAGGYTVQFRDRGETVTMEAPSYRPVGYSMGVFVFGGRTYFDTFYDSWGDLRGERKGDPMLANTLAVLIRDDNKTMAVCEFVWHPRRQK